MQTDAPLLNNFATAVRGFARTVMIWQDRRRTRRALMRLSERSLKDIGLCRDQALGEYDKPFWRK